MVIQPVAPSVSACDANGWPKGFFEQTYGAFSEEPLDRPPQGEYDARESFR